MSFDQALTTLQESIAQDAFLQSANFEPYIITKSLTYHKNNVDATLKALTKCAKWHKEYLGHQSKRVSIVHVHAFLLMEIATFVPHAKDPEGRPVYLFYGFKDTRSVPKQFHATFNMWNHFRILRSADHDNDNYTLVVNLEGSKLKNFRPSQYKRLDEANACQPLQSTDTTLYVVNASKFTEKLVNASLRIMKSMGPSKLHFIKPAELSNHLDVSLIPVDFGGRRSLGDVRADMEDFIRAEYAREGLRYEAIDAERINWKTYKVPDLDLTIRPDTAMSIASNMDFDQLDAQLEKMGLNDASEE